MNIKTKNLELYQNIFSEEIKVDAKSELRKELNGYKKKYLGAKDDIRNWEEMNCISVQSPKISVKQLNDCIMFIINEQLSRERFIQKEFYQDE